MAVCTISCYLVGLQLSISLEGNANHLFEWGIVPELCEHSSVLSCSEAKALNCISIACTKV